MRYFVEYIYTEGSGVVVVWMDSGVVKERMWNSDPSTWTLSVRLFFIYYRLNLKYGTKWLTAHTQGRVSMSTIYYNVERVLNTTNLILKLLELQIQKSIQKIHEKYRIRFNSIIMMSDFKYSQTTFVIIQVTGNSTFFAENVVVSCLLHYILT